MLPKEDSTGLSREMGTKDKAQTNKKIKYLLQQLVEYEQRKTEVKTRKNK